MKKLIFLALMAFALVGFVSAAGVAYPPWGVTLEAALSEYSVDGHAVTSDTVLAMVTPLVAQPSSIPAVLAFNDFIAIRPHSGFEIMVGLKLNQFSTGYEAASYYLRL